MKKFINLLGLLLLVSTTPVIAQETSAVFSQSVKIGFDNRTCDGSLSGSVRFSSANGVEFCNGAGWAKPSSGASSCPITVTSGLVARWPMDESSGKVAHDNVGDGELILPVAASWQPTGGIIGGAIEFTASAPWLGLITTNTSLLQLTSFTYCTWFNTSNGIGNFITWDNLSGGAAWLGVGFGTTQSLYFWANATGTDFGGDTGNVFPLNTWHHMCVSWDNTVLNTSFKFYKNGASTAITWSQSGTGSPESRVINDTALKFATYDNPSSIIGLLDDMVLYNRVLSAGEIATLYADYDACIP